uniref:Col_cuticle_N domain-containing protein n=1 Tax=Meloidogyne floridensis TaxID=298350 RepID=A0A915P640_9BILA
MLKLISSFQKLIGVQKRINKPSLNNSPTKEDLNIQRLYILSLALTAIAFCILSLIIPILISELDELNEIANNERKVFNQMAKEIWHQLIYIRGSFNGKNTYSRLLQLKRRTERESPLNGSESKRFLDFLERKSFKGRQRLRQHSNLREQLEGNQITPNSAAPRARTFSYGTIQGIQEKKPKEKVFSVALKCEKGPPGEKGLAGIDGIPGQNGEPGKPGQSTEEQETNFKDSGCIKCPAGPPGLPGEIGVPGIKGEAGIPGLPGKAKKALPGKPGLVGDKGLDGVNGMDGEPGFPGVPGIKYSKGPQGQKGPIGQGGPPGLPGDEGAKGENGPPGEAGWQGLPGENGPDGQTGPVGLIGDEGFPGIEKHYCNCPVRTSHLRKLKEQSGGIDAYLGRWKGRLPNQLIDDYERYVKEKDSVINKIKTQIVQN